MHAPTARRRRGLWLRWTIRDGRRRWVVLVVLGVIIGAGTGTYAALSSMSTWRRVSYNASYQLLHSHDVHVELQDSTISAGRLAAIVDGLPVSNSVAARAERLLVATTVDASTSARAILVEGRVVGADLSSDAPVDAIHVDHGRTLTAADATTAKAVLESKFAKFYALPPTGTLRVAGGASVGYVGVGVGPEQFIITGGQGGLQSEATFATLYTSLATAQQLSGQTGKVNDLVVRLRPGADPTVVSDAIKYALKTSLPDVAAQVSALSEEDTHRFLYRDIGNDQRFFDVFAVIILAGVALAAFNLSNRIVEAQRREIGIGQALGLRPAALARRPLLIGVQIAVAGIVAGLGIGLVLNVALRGFLTGFLPMPIWRTPFQTGLYLRTSLFAAVLPIAASAYPVWRATRVPPIEALRSGALTARRGGLLRLLHPRRHGRLMTVLPVRAVLRTPRRTLFTAIGIAASLTTVVAVLGMLDTFRHTITRSEAELYGTSSDRVTVQLDHFYPADAEIVHALTTRSSVKRVDLGITIPIQLVPPNAGQPLEAIAERYQTNTVWQPTVNQPMPTGDTPGIVLTGTAARDLGVRPGDRVVVRHPQRTDTGFTVAETTMIVAGLNPNPLRGFVYLNDQAVTAAGLGGLVNTLAVTPTGDSQQLTRDVFGQPGVTVVRPVTATTRILRDWVGDFSEFLRIVEIIVLPLALLIAYNAASVASEERAREHATMLAIGMRTRTIISTAMAESTLIGMLGTILGLIGGWFALGWVIHVASQTLPDLGLDRTIHLGTYTVAALVGVVAVGLAPILLTRRVSRINIPATIRTVE